MKRLAKLNKLGYFYRRQYQKNFVLSNNYNRLVVKYFDNSLLSYYLKCATHDRYSVEDLTKCATHNPQCNCYAVEDFTKMNLSFWKQRSHIFTENHFLIFYTEKVTL